jgi:hypothetical protein
LAHQRIPIRSCPRTRASSFRSTSIGNEKTRVPACKGAGGTAIDALPGSWETPSQPPPFRERRPVGAVCAPLRLLPRLGRFNLRPLPLKGGGREGVISAAAPARRDAYQPLRAPSSKVDSASPGVRGRPR